VAATGATVVVPEVPEWVALELAPHRTRAAVEAGLTQLASESGAAGKPGLMGFSFGGPQVLRAAADRGVGDRLACVAAVGGYGDLERTVRFLMTGIHEWEGTAYRVRPDPYGRWIVAANYLTGVTGHEGDGEVGDSLRELAAYAGDQIIESWDPELDPVKERLLAALDETGAGVFRTFAPPAGEDPPRPSPEILRLASELTAAGVRRDPNIHLPDRLDIPVPVVLLHGQNDHLIPFSESLRMAQRIRSPELRVTVTRLFAHSEGDPGPESRRAWARELVRLGDTLGYLLTRPG
jgi:dienelactone hydrolase